MFDTFEGFVKDCAENSKSEFIRNSSIEHAKIIVRELFNCAIRDQQDVRISSGKLQEDFYDDMVDLGRKAMDQDVHVSVVVLDSAEEQLQGNSFYETVEDHANGRVFTLDLPETETHYVLVGDSRYRVEFDDVTKEAVASFNDGTVGHLLADVHEGYLRTAAAPA